MIPLGNQGKRIYWKAAINILFAICAAGFAIFAILENNTDYFYGTGAFYLIQLIECCFSTTYSYISNIKSIKDIVKLIDRLRKTRPDIYFTIQNYHRETRTRIDMSGNINRTVTY